MSLPSGVTRELLLELAGDLGRALALLPEDQRLYYYGGPTEKGVLVEALGAVGMFLREDVDERSP